MQKKIFTALIIAIGIFISLSSSVKAQDQYQGEEDWEEYGLEYRMFRFALIPGLSTNGLDATNYASKYSLNIWAGYNGALDDGGFELGGILNANKYYAHGVQIAGLANYSGEETAGVQLAGLGNISGDNMQGIQLSGIGNLALNDLQGIQLSGIFNLSGGYSQGLQSAGIVNLSRTGMQGLFSAGIGNLTGGEMQGLLFSGIFNISLGEMQGIVSSGVVNYAEIFQGIGLSTINISNEFQGINMGVLNIAGDGQGIQAGIFNYADSFEGLPVGLISYYGDGRKNIDAWTSETGFTNFGVKLGTEEIYNMISIGYNPLLDRDVWQVGWSIGRLHQYEKHSLYNDFSYYKINEDTWTKDLNSIFKYRLLFGKEFSSGFMPYVGPTFNMLISRVEESNDYTLYRLLDYEANNRQYVFWIGATLGVELF